MIKLIKKHFLFFLILAWSFILRLPGLAARPIWHDEAFSIKLASLDLVSITSKTALDVHPPFYYYLLHFWIKIFGTSEIGVRSLSLILGLFLILGVYIFTLKFFSKSIALFSSFIVGIAPFAIQYSQETRMYMLASSLGIFSLYFLLKALEKNKITSWIGYTLISIAFLYTHYFAFFGIFAQFLWVLIFKKINKSWLISQFILFLSYLPWLPIFFNQATRVKQGFWIPPVSFYSVPRTFFMFFFGSIPVKQIFLIAIVPFSLFILIYPLFLYKNLREKFFLLLIYLITPFCFILALSPIRSLYIDRYFLIAAPAFWIFLGSCLGSFKSYKIKFYLLLFIFLLTGIGLFYWISLLAQNKIAFQDRRVVARYVMSNYKPTNLILVTSPYIFFDFSYYLKYKVFLFSKEGIPNIPEASLLEESDIIKNLKDLKGKVIFVVGYPNDPVFSEFRSFKLIEKQTLSGLEIRKYLYLKPYL